MSDLRKAAEMALDAMEAMMAEFKALDLPYGSKAYALAKDARLDLRTALANCDYPDCVDNGLGGKCTRWLLAECEKSEDYQPPQREPMQDHEDWCASVTQLLMSYPPRKAPCNCKKRDLPGVSDEQ